MNTLNLKNKIAILILSIVITLPTLAQQNETVELPNQPQNAIAFVPQYAFFKGIRVDYEKRLKNSDHWVVIAPQIFLDAANTNYYYYDDGNYDNYESMAGFGLNLYYKSIIFKSDKVNWKSGLPRHSLYFSAGPNFQHFSLTNTEEVAVPYIEDGTTYYQFDVQEVKKPINRFGGVADVGWQLAFDRFLLDLYLGVAIKYSVDENGSMIKSDYSQWTDMSYTGILLDGGVRVGMFF